MTCKLTLFIEGGGGGGGGRREGGKRDGREVRELREGGLLVFSHALISDTQITHAMVYIDKLTIQNLLPNTCTQLHFPNLISMQ